MTRAAMGPRPGRSHARRGQPMTGPTAARSSDCIGRQRKRRLAGRGSTDARLLAVVRAAGIGWQLARMWPGSRARERQIKRQGGHARKCPLCGVTPRRLPRNADGSLSRSRTTDAQKAAAGLMTAPPARRAHRAAPRRDHRQAAPPPRTRPAGR